MSNIKELDKAKTNSQQPTQRKKRGLLFWFLCIITLGIWYFLDKRRSKHSVSSSGIVAVDSASAAINTDGRHSCGQQELPYPRAVVRPLITLGPTAQTCIAEFLIPNVGKIQIRRMLATDHASVSNIEKCAFSTHAPCLDEQLISDFVANSSYGCWLVINDSKVIAYAIYKLADYEAHLLWLAVVDPDYHNKKIGHRFLSFLLERMQSDKVTKVKLETMVSNAAARKLYANLGFKEQGLKKDYYPNLDGSREDGIDLVLNFSVKPNYGSINQSFDPVVAASNDASITLSSCFR